MYKSIILVVLVCVCVACGSTSIKPADCNSMSWFDQGLKDGGEGKGKGLLEKYQHVCGAKAGADQYEKGYITGLKNFCTYENGHEYGAKGSEPHACPEGTEYKAGHEKGYAKYLDLKERRVLERMTRPSGNSDLSPAAGSVGP